MNITITIQFPALSALVAYLAGNDAVKIDALRATAELLTKSLSSGATELQNSVEQQKP